MSKAKQNVVAVPSESSRLPVRVTSTLVDRWEGTSTTEIIWGSQPNLKYVGECSLNKSVRKSVSKFFVSRQAGAVMRNMITGQFFRPAETAFTKAEYHSALSNVESSPVAVGMIMELTLPALVKLGLISAAIDYSRQIDYDFSAVTIDAIKTNVLVYQIVEAAKAGQLKIEGKDRLSKSVFAEMVGDAFRDIGYALEGMTDLSEVIDDLVLGVRAHIDYTFAIDPTAASVPTEWRNNRLVAELATNLVFVRAALSLPVGANMRLKSDMWKLEKFAPVVMSAIKSSDRFAWVSKEEALATLQIAKIRDIEGRPVSAVIGRSVQVVPVAQAVMAVEDVAMQHAFNITATKDRIAEAIQIAYGKATFSLLDGAQMLADNVREYVEAGWRTNKQVYMVDTRSGMTKEDVALLLADVLHVEVENGKVKAAAVLEGVAEGVIESGVVEWNPVWWYSVDTREKSLRVWNGRHLGDSIITSSADEVVLAADEREARASLPARQQLLSPQAFNTRLMSFDTDKVMSVEKRFSFSVAIAGVSMKGSFNATDFASLRSSTYTKVTKPFFNEEVVRGLQLAYVQCQDVDGTIDSSGADDWEHGKVEKQVSAYVRRRYARMLLRLAQQLDAAFRHEVQQVMIERAVHSGDLKGSAADQYRSKLGQKSFMAYCDVVALLFFLHVQGIDRGVWTDIASSKEMAETCMEFGSDRNM